MTAVRRRFTTLVVLATAGFGCAAVGSFTGRDVWHGAAGTLLIGAMLAFAELFREIEPLSDVRTVYSWLAYLGAASAWTVAAVTGSTAAATTADVLFLAVAPPLVAQYFARLWRMIRDDAADRAHRQPSTPSSS